MISGTEISGRDKYGGSDVMWSCNIGRCVVDADDEDEEEIDEHQPFPSLSQVCAAPTDKL